MTSKLDALSHDLVFQILSMLPVPSLCRAAQADRTLAIAAGMLLRGRSCAAKVVPRSGAPSRWCPSSQGKRERCVRCI